MKLIIHIPEDQTKILVNEAQNNAQSIEDYILDLIEEEVDSINCADAYIKEHLRMPKKHEKHQA
jgi:hypothetical protein